MDDYENKLVVRKKQYAYIYLVILLIFSILGSATYFSNVKNKENGVLESGDVEISNNIVNEDANIKKITIVDDYKNEEIIVNNDITQKVVEDNSGDIVENKLDEKDNENIVDKDGNINYFTNNRKLDPNKKMVALTFDDGPDPKKTVKMLEVLKKYNAVATFFDIGNLMEKYPDVVKKEIEAGCDVGGHTYSHVNLNSLSQAEVKKEIANVEKAFKNATGYELKYIRPTYGNANSSVREVIDRPIINWCVDSLDWQSRNADKVIEEIRKTQNLDGRIILMHVIYDSTIEAMERLIPELIEEGYQIVTVSEMAEYKGFELKEGKIYYDFVK